jgi:hypothetical protein
MISLPVLFTSEIISYLTLNMGSNKIKALITSLPVYLDTSETISYLALNMGPNKIKALMISLPSLIYE